MAIPLQQLSPAPGNQFPPVDEQLDYLQKGAAEIIRLSRLIRYTDNAGGARFSRTIAPTRPEGTAAPTKSVSSISMYAR